MKYKVLIAQIEKIASPVVVHYNGQTMQFSDGMELTAFEWDASYTISDIKAEDNSIIIHLDLLETDDAVGSFF